jgi:hypothetical protein
VHRLIEATRATRFADGLIQLVARTGADACIERRLRRAGRGRRR